MTWALGGAQAPRRAGLGTNKTEAVISRSPGVKAYISYTNILQPSRPKSLLTTERPVKREMLWQLLQRFVQSWPGKSATPPGPRK